MLSFHNDPEINKKYLNRVRAHQLEDEIAQGLYVDEENKRYCAVGCTIHSSNHKAYKEELGIPRILEKLEDGIFENLPIEIAKMWPEEFLNSIEIGIDLSEVWPKFAIWLLIDKKYGVLQFAKTEKLKKCIQLVADYYKDHKKITIAQWKIASADAASAASCYAASAAYTADASSASYAAYTAAYAAASAASDAASAASYAASADDKFSIVIAQADKLLELLREAGK